MRRLLILLIIGLIAGVSAVFVFSYMATRPTPSEVGQLSNNEQELSLTAEDGIRISASFFPAEKSDAPIVLMFHGIGSSRSIFQSHVTWLNRAGYSAMAIDLRGHGESEAHNKSFGLYEARDAEAAVNWIRANHPTSKIAVIGASLGGAASLLGSDGPLPVDAMILKAVYPDIDRAIRNRVAVYGGRLLSGAVTPMLTYQSPMRYDAWPDDISPVKAAQGYAGAVLVIGGEEDVYTPPEESQQLAEAFPGKQSVWIVDGLSHEDTAALDNAAYRQRVLAFLKAEIG